MKDALEMRNLWLLKRDREPIRYTDRESSRSQMREDSYDCEIELTEHKERIAYDSQYRQSNSTYSNQQWESIKTEQSSNASNGQCLELVLHHTSVSASSAGHIEYEYPPA